MDHMGSASNGIAFYYFDMELNFGLHVHYFGNNSVVTATVSISFNRTSTDLSKLLSEYTCFIEQTRGCITPTNGHQLLILNDQSL